MKWRKTSFYTVLRGSDLKLQARRVNGVTDGELNYYKGKGGKWIAVLPDCGLSIAESDSRQRCRDRAQQLLPIPEKLYARDDVKAAMRCIYNAETFVIGGGRDDY